ncbi:MAG: ABC transporter ATP-binding protein/permease [Desulfosarcinaceae bacterium]|nr:ABC transporter ATP-binding protein/permease [Desulfosarcinaceae bacterium]
MAKLYRSIVERPLRSWIFTSGITHLQGALVVVILGVVFARVLPLEMQKRIINEAINLRKIDLLFLYCGFYLAAVVAANGFKFAMNALQAVISQRATARMREALYHHALTLPLTYYRNTQPGAVVNAVINELTLPGNYIGMAVAVPLSNVLTLVAFAAYLAWLNLWLAALSLSIYPLVLFLVPLLQRKVNQANKQRVDASRKLSSRISESIGGIHEIQANGAYTLENRKFDKIVRRLLKIRIRWSLYRFAIKVTNNFFVSLGPFLVFILGGWLTIKGRLELGALVAFLSAQEKLYDPWRELIEFYQVYQDGRVSYDRTMALFNVPPEHRLIADDRPPHQLERSIEVKDLSFITRDGIRLLDRINLTLKSGEHLALVGFSGSGKSTLALCLGQLYSYDEGRATIGGHEIAELTKQDLVANVGFVSQTPFIFQGTIEENLLYAYTAQHDGGPPPELDDMIAALQQAGIFIDVLRFGLNTIIAPGERPELVEAVIRVRNNFRQDYGTDLSEWVEFFDESQYLYHSSIEDNLIFGSAQNPDLCGEKLLTNPFFMQFLDEADLNRTLLALGAALTRQTVDLLGNLPPDELFFKQSPLEPAELDTYKAVAAELRQRNLHQLDPHTQRRLLSLALRFTPGLHKMVALDTLLERLILEGRVLFRERIEEQMPEAVTFYRLDQYSYGQTILNNILFGKTKTEQTQARERIYQSIIQLLIEEDFLEAAVAIGMQYDVGRGGDKLSGGQRQKLAIARAFLKRPRILIMDEATSALDNKSQGRIQNIIEKHYKGKSTLIAVVHRLDIIKNYDKVAVMKAGKIVEMGTYDELIAKEGQLYELEFGRP